MAQENNYWNQQVGSVSSLTGGASIANSRDNSAIFYNPSGLAFVENSSLSAVADAYFLSLLTIRNGAGKGIDLKSRTVDTTPSIFSGILKNRKNPDLSVTYAILNKTYSFIRMNAHHEMMYDVLPDRPGDELYIGNYEYYNRIREDWLGIGLGHKLGERFGVGSSLFIAIRTQDFSRSYDANVLEPREELAFASSLASSSFSEVFEHRNIGIVWKFGMNYTTDALKVGLNLTVPKLNLGIIPGSLRRQLSTRIPGPENLAPVFSTNQEKVRTTHRLPLTVDLGATYTFRSSELSLRITYINALKPYSLLKPVAPSNEIEKILRTDEEGFNTMMDASSTLVNIGLGYKLILNEGWALLCGYRSDFNYFDDNALSRQENYVPSISYWDLHHLSAGFSWYGQKYILSTGFNYGFGNAAGIQEVNFTEPTVENFLFGPRDNSARVTYHQIGINLGFVYLFSRI